jgi:hypothetical protein
VIGALALAVGAEVIDAPVEVVDQPEPDVDVGPPPIRQLQPVQQLLAGDAERVADRAGMPERTDAAWTRFFSACDGHQVQPEARGLALAADGRIGKPELTAEQDLGTRSRADSVYEGIHDWAGITTPR